MKTFFYRTAAAIVLSALFVQADAKRPPKTKPLSPVATPFNNPLPPTTPYGSIYSASSWTNTNDFITRGNTTATLSGNYVNITSSTKDDWNNIVNITGYQTKLEKWRFKVRFKIIAWAGNSYGLGFGLKSANAYVQNDIMGFVQTTSSGTGGLYIVKSGRTTVATGPTISFTLNDVIDLDGQFYDSTFYFTAHNITSGSTGSLSFTYATNGSTIAVPNTSYFSLMELGGTHQIQNIDISSTELAGANLVTLGDSKTIGYFTNTFTGRYAAQLNNNYPDAVINAGGADLVINALNRQNELVRLGANKYLLSIGSNDIRYNQTLQQLQTNYDSLVRILQATGATVYHIVLPEDYTKTLGRDLTPFKNWVAATYPAFYIEVWDSMSTGNILKGIYDTGDGVHINQLGNNKIYQAIVASHKLDATTLPVDLLSFTGEQTGVHQADIRWTVDATQQADTYTLLKSNDGTTFTALANIPNYVTGSYSYSDNNFVDPVNYYKLRIIEPSHFTWYSNRIIVRRQQNDGNFLRVLKVNGSDNLFTCMAGEKCTAAWHVINATGKQIAAGTQPLNKGFNQFSLNIVHLAAGIYYLQLSAAGTNHSAVCAFIK